jgi:hypothetical protein
MTHGGLKIMAITVIIIVTRRVNCHTPRGIIFTTLIRRRKKERLLQPQKWSTKKKTTKIDVFILKVDCGKIAELRAEEEDGRRVSNSSHLL